MTHQPLSEEFALASNPLEQFARARSSCIDAFAKLETAICQCIVQFDCERDGKKVPLSQRLTALSKVQPSCHLSKENARLLRKLAQTCDAILTIRGTMVHSVMSLGKFNGEPVATFRNAMDVVLDTPIHLLLTKEKFKALEAEVQALAARFNDCLPAQSSRRR